MSFVLMLMVVVMVLFLVVVVVAFLDLGRLEVGHWSKALLTQVVLHCPPLHLVLWVTRLDNI